MKKELLDIRDQQRNSWDTFSPGWKKWDDFTMQFLGKQGESIIEALDLNPSAQVLDIASGTGEPGLTIAAQVLKGGTVTATDLSEKMLNIAALKAEALNISNFKTQVADACALPFKDNSFDAISCRLGFMFFPDITLAASEMLRVLKPGGILATTVWAEPAKNLWITTAIGALKKHVDFPNPDPKGPGLFRCAAPNYLNSLFESLGVSGGLEKDINGILPCDSAEDYWDFLTDVVPPVVATLKKVSEADKALIKATVFELFEAQKNQEYTQMAFGSRLFTVRKPK